ncbi:MAG: adenylate kinase [Candidatus Omnitrophica bacterium]|nr:adenylate kinase [Candidatus Omnitrophota bacterium]
MRIILLGPPGAGKGTQAKILAKELNVSHISTGDLLRQNVSEGTDLGKEAKDFMNKGLLVPDELIRQMLTKRFSRPDVKAGFILDGYPRNINQAQTLEDILAGLKMGIDLVIDLATSESVIIQRLSGRLVCSQCGANFHIRNMPPKKEMTCDNCGGKLYQRSDDKEETIKKRLAVYAAESASLIKYYQDKEKLYTISANEDAQVVLKKMLDLIDKRDDPLKV